MSKEFISAGELAELLGVSVSSGYKYVHQMNLELQEKGFLTVRGKVPAAYAKKRFFFGESENGKS